MKKIIYFIVFILHFSCSNNDDLSTFTSSQNTNSNFLNNLQIPNIINHEIESGLIKGERIESLYYQRYNTNPFNYFFEYLENSNRIKKITILNPEYNCIVTYLDYLYNTENLISKIELTTINSCFDEISYKTYNYNYQNNILKSIIMNNEIVIEENHFSYNLDGSIAEIYTSNRLFSEQLEGYVKYSYTYDENQNVIEYKREDFRSNTYDKKYTFTYDDNENKYKGFLVSMSFYQPSAGIDSNAGPIFLSNNNILSVKKEYIHNNSQPQYEYFTYNYENAKLIDYGSEQDYEYWHRYYLNY